MRKNPLRRTAPGLGAEQTEPTMVKLLALLIAITMSCGVAAAVTISLAPQSAERVVAGY
jgi:type III secretory pathway component EscS